MTDWPESAQVRVEQCIMIGCYCVRKLIEARKLTDRVRERTISLGSHPAQGKPVHLMNWHNIDKLYDLEQSQERLVNLPFLCNQLIHSYVFVCGFNARGGLTSVFFCSDRQRNSCLFHISTRVLANAFAAVSRDGVWSAHSRWDAKTQDYAVSNK